MASGTVSHDGQTERWGWAHCEFHFESVDLDKSTEEWFVLNPCMAHEFTYHTLCITNTPPRDLEKKWKWAWPSPLVLFPRLTTHFQRAPPWALEMLFGLKNNPFLLLLRISPFLELLDVPKKLYWTHLQPISQNSAHTSFSISHLLN